MRKIILFIMLIFTASTVYAAKGNLYTKFKDYPEIKIFLKEVIDNTENPNVEIGIFKNEFKKSLHKRIEIKFRYVENEKDADVSIKAAIKSHIFKGEALPSVMSVWAFTADTASPKSSSKLIVDYEIVDPKTGEEMLYFKNFTTEARRPRIKTKDPKAAYRFAVKNNVNRFIYRTFYKQTY